MRAGIYVLDYIGPIAQLPGLLGIYFFMTQRHSPRVRVPARGRRGTSGDLLRHPDESGSTRRTRHLAGGYT